MHTTTMNDKIYLTAAVSSTGGEEEDHEKSERGISIPLSFSHAGKWYCYHLSWKKDRGKKRGKCVDMKKMIITIIINIPSLTERTELLYLHSTLHSHTREKSMHLSLQNI